MASDKPALLTADDLSPLVQKLSPQEQVRLAYYALRIARATAKTGVDASADGKTHPDMREFHRSLGIAPYPANTVLEMRGEEER